MQQLTIIIHLLLCFSIIGLVLLQQGKGAQAGAAFGSGASQTVFGSRGTGSFLFKFTAICAAGYFATNLYLGILAKNEFKKSHAVQVSAPQSPVPGAPTSKKGS